MRRWSPRKRRGKRVRKKRAENLKRRGRGYHVARTIQPEERGEREEVAWRGGRSCGGR